MITPKPELSEILSEQESGKPPSEHPSKWGTNPSHGRGYRSQASTAIQSQRGKGIRGTTSSYVESSHERPKRPLKNYWNERHKRSRSRDHDGHQRKFSPPPDSSDRLVQAFMKLFNVTNSYQRTHKPTVLRGTMIHQEVIIQLQQLGYLEGGQCPISSGNDDVAYLRSVYVSTLTTIPVESMIGSFKNGTAAIEYIISKDR